MCLKCLISSLFSRMCRRAVCHFIKKRDYYVQRKGLKTFPNTPNQHRLGVQDCRASNQESSSWSAEAPAMHHRLLSLATTFA